MPSPITKITTIKIKNETKLRVDKLKIHSRESYDETIQRILSILNICKLSPFQARSKLDEIDAIRDKIKVH